MKINPSQKLTKYLVLSLLGVSCFIYTAFVDPSTADVIEYPAGYRDWTHVKTTLKNGPNVIPARAGFQHIYANEKAMEGYQSGNFPDGSVIVFDVLESVVNKNGNTEEGPRRFVDVMVKNSQKYDSTGGWGFEEFMLNSIYERNVLQFSKQKCFNCHASQKKKGFVFSDFRK